jgi:predicted permease
MEQLLSDVRYGTRMLRKNPANTLVAILSLALGLGASTALFSVYDAVILRPLPVADPDQLVVFLWQPGGKGFLMQSHSGFLVRERPGTPGVSGSFSYPLFQRFHEQQVLSHTFGFYALGRVNVQADGVSELAAATVVTGEYFAGLGLRPWAGRLLVPSDDRPGNQPAAVLSHAYWLKRFAGDSSAVGKAIFVNGQPFTIAGIAPREFYGTIDYETTPEIFLPMAYRQKLEEWGTDIFSDHEFWWVGVMGRLKPGLTLAAAQAALTPAFLSSVEELDEAKKNPKDPRPRLVLKPGAQGQAEFRQRNAQSLYVALGVVALILLIACGNVANLLLARAGARQREVALRMALGSHRRRLIRQLLTESLLLAAISGLLGVVLAFWVKGLLFTWLPLSLLPDGIQIPLDQRVLAASGAVCAFTAMVFGLAPALQATRVDLANSLKESAGSLAGSRPRQRLGKAMVIVQLALSVVVLAGAGLLLRTLLNLENSGTGFNPQNILTFRLDGSLSGYRGDALLNLYDEVRRRTELLPGVRSVGTLRSPLISGSTSRSSVTFLGYTPKPDEDINVHVHLVTGELFRTVEAPVLLGRDFTPRDNQPGAPPVAIVNETIARRYFPASSPVGQRMDFDDNGKGKIEIVGVVRDMKYARLREVPPPTVYIPARLREDGVREVTFLVRTAGDPMQLAPLVNHMVHELDANLPVFSLRPQDEIVRASLNREREASRLLAFFAALALTLAAIGLYGLMAHTVSSRTNEIGIRMALGAQGRDVFRLVLRQGLFLVLLGVAAGLAGAWWATRVLQSQLYGVQPNDAATLAGVTGLLVAVALLACYFPARRATQVSPIVALRYE